MDQDAIDRLQCQYFQNKLATVEARRVEEAAKRVRRLASKIRNGSPASPRPSNTDDLPRREH
jgi:hypothetical protein